MYKKSLLFVDDATKSRTKLSDDSIMEQVEAIVVEYKPSVALITEILAIR